MNNSINELQIKCDELMYMYFEVFQFQIHLQLK